MELIISQITSQPKEVEELNDISTLKKSLSQFNTEFPPGMLITEVLSPDDSRRWLNHFNHAKETKIEDLYEEEPLRFS